MKYALNNELQGSRPIRKSVLIKVSLKKLKCTVRWGKKSGCAACHLTIRARRPFEFSVRPRGPSLFDPVLIWANRLSERCGQRIGLAYGIALNNLKVAGAGSAPGPLPPSAVWIPRWNVFPFLVSGFPDNCLSRLRFYHWLLALTMGFACIAIALFPWTDYFFIWPTILSVIINICGYGNLVPYNRIIWTVISFRE